MKVLAITIALVAIANARPDVSHLPSAGYLPVGHHSGSGQSGYDHSNIVIGSGSVGGYHQEQDQKHVYFYASPDDHHYTHLRINVVPKSQKNTKIIFIKAPHHAGVIPEVVAPPSLSEDKTLVYVLVKKPVDGQSISIPAGLGVKQVKPQVYFIKYNNKHEAEAQVNSGVQGQNVGVNVPELPNEYTFVNALDSYGAHGAHGVSGGGHYQAGGAIDGYHGAGISTHIGIADSAGKHGPTGASGPY